MDQLDVTETAAGDILFGVCCRDPPTRHDELIALLGGGITVPLATFHYLAMKALQYNG
jgi:hypothetical protein